MKNYYVSFFAQTIMICTFVFAAFVVAFAPSLLPAIFTQDPEHALYMVLSAFFALTSLALLFSWNVQEQVDRILRSGEEEKIYLFAAFDKIGNVGIGAVLLGGAFTLRYLRDPELLALSLALFACGMMLCAYGHQQFRQAILENGKPEPKPVV